MKEETTQKILEQTKEGYNQIADHFSATRVWPWKVMEKFFAYLRPGDKILDIGCGNGRLFEAIKDKNIEYVGIDNSERLIEKARGKYQLPVTGYQLPVFQVMDALNLQFQKEEFNTVFMMAVLSHIPSEKLQIQALENVYRVLKSGGCIFITCWNFWQPKLFWKNLKNRIKNPKFYRGLGWKDFLITWRNSQREILSQRFYHAFSKREIKKILEKAGFKIEQIYYEYKGEKSNWLKGFNLVGVARK